MDAISPKEQAIAIVQTTEISLLMSVTVVFRVTDGTTAYRLKNRQGAPPFVKAVATTLDNASQVAIKQRHRLPSDHTE